jgi:hypothetical protein
MVTSTGRLLSREDPLSYELKQRAYVNSRLVIHPSSGNIFHLLLMRTDVLTIHGMADKVVPP